MTVPMFQREVSHCEGRCSSCRVALAPSDGDMGITGLGLVGWSAAVFLMPLAGMVLGAVWSGEGSRQLVGAIAGGGVGVAFVRALLRLVRGAGGGKLP